MCGEHINISGTKSNAKLCSSVRLRTVRACVYERVRVCVQFYSHIEHVYRSVYPIHCLHISALLPYSGGANFSVCSFGFNCLCVNCKVTRIKIIRSFVQIKKNKKLRGERNTERLDEKTRNSVQNICYQAEHICASCFSPIPSNLNQLNRDGKFCVFSKLQRS